MSRSAGAAFRSRRPTFPSLTICTLLLLVISISSAAVAASPESDALLKLKGSLINTDALASWNGWSTPCTGDTANWVGVLCSKGAVWGMQLEGMGLAGNIDVDALASIPNLRTVSFRDNNFTGPMPDLGKLGVLKSIFLSGNKFSGTIPAGAFSNMRSLKKLYLSGNEFNGEIPDSLAGLPKLLELRLEENMFTGGIPDFKQPELKMLNVSYNQLVGQIPAVLSKFDRSSFAGNQGLCGQPLATPCKSSKSSSPSAVMVAIVVIAIGAGLAIVAAICFLCRRNKKATESCESPPANHNKVASLEDSSPVRGLTEKSIGDKTAGKVPDLGTLVFVRDDRDRFELQDLLRASAEVLGSGRFGSSYKAVLLSGPALVVKRFREMGNVDREVFQEHIRRLGRLRHPNLLPVLAFYYRKEEKLLVSDYVPNGSLAYFLHGNKTRNRPLLDWTARLRIIKGVARGLAYLYQELPDLVLPHGHLKSSNILLTNTFEPLFTNYALSPMFSPEHAAQVMEAYKSPEYAQYGHTTKKSDLWSLGVLILEMLTGKFSEQGKGGADLASWVHSVVREEWTGEVFDGDMTKTKGGEGEMLKLLKVGLGCCEREVEKRWEVREAIQRINELRESGVEEEESSSFGSVEEENSSRGVTDNEFSFSVS